MTNWYVGKRIKEDVLFNQRAEYGKQVLRNLATKLTGRYGRGWSEKHLRHCLRSADTFSEEEIVSATQRQLTWTHHPYTAALKKYLKFKMTEDIM